MDQMIFGKKLTATYLVNREHERKESRKCMLLQTVQAYFLPGTLLWDWEQYLFLDFLVWIPELFAT